MVYIYTLASSNNPEEIRYIGETFDLKDRLKRHLKKVNKEGTYKSNWIKSVLDSGNKIIMEVLDIVDDNEWEFWETFYICLFKSWGFKLTNSTIGGRGMKLNRESINKRSKTIFDKNSKKLKSFLEKYNIHLKNNNWHGSRFCPNCNEEIEYKKKERKDIIAVIKRAVNGERKCNSCSKSGLNNGFYGKNHSSDIINKYKELYGKKIKQYDSCGNLIGEFNSIREAHQITGINRRVIKGEIKNSKKNKNNFKFKIE